MEKLKLKINWALVPYYSIQIRLITMTLFICVLTADALFRFHNNFSFFYILVMALVGLCMLDVKLQLIFSFVVAASVAYMSPFPFSPFSLIIPWLSNFITCFIITSCVKMNIREQKNQIAMIETLISAIESKDQYTAAHSIKVAKYAAVIAKTLRYSDSECELIYIGGLLHDIGKIGISDQILNKASSLTREEYDTIRHHSFIGFHMLQHMDLQDKDKILQMILYHHERFDGQGYPNNIRISDLPQRVAIISLADSYDAMTSKRVYRDKHDNNYAISEIEKNSGTQFDPIVAKAFLHYLKNHQDFSVAQLNSGEIQNCCLVEQ